MQIEITESELQLINLYRELDSWGYSELECKWRDNKVVKLRGIKEYKPIDTTRRLQVIQKCAIMGVEIGN